ncbi:hypothetical protein ACFPZ0_00710 [Streptomonospora nanhaiensis]|uniref:hypothetical protein n=1 Tax=Streptomonospora nanhaiensis TaxID=1323731 RepID=UPI001C99AAD2|nr:hypothetical protein [Streptomonospora nanhaiensis]MBX9386920.1 hypothetical protein [Streptomonospora nanhaiensis]
MRRSILEPSSSLRCHWPSASTISSVDMPLRDSVALWRAQHWSATSWSASWHSWYSRSM